MNDDARNKISQLPVAANDQGEAGEQPDDQYRLRLYVAGETPKSLAAIANLRKLCEENLPEPYVIEVVDLAKNPELAAIDQILAVPTLVRRLPPPPKRIIGSLADAEKVLDGLQLRKDRP